MPESKFEPRPSILVGDTADVYLHRALSVFRAESLNPLVTVDVRSAADGVCCGIEEAKALLEKVLPETDREVWLLDEGENVSANEVAVRIKAHYSAFALYETAICGILSQSTGWATAARQCVEAAEGIPVVCFGARYVHPNSAALMDYASVVGGCVSCSTVLGAKLAGVTPHGTLPHSLVLVMGDTVKAMQSFDKHMPQDVPRLAVVDTLVDEVNGSVMLAKAMREKLRGVRLDAPSGQKSLTPDLVKELRVRLDIGGFEHVEIFVSGALDPETIQEYVKSGAPVNGFGVGRYIATASPIPFRADIYEIEGKPAARRGRTPGVVPSKRLERFL